MHYILSTSSAFKKVLQYYIEFQKKQTFTCNCFTYFQNKLVRSFDTNMVLKTFENSILLVKISENIFCIS